MTLGTTPTVKAGIADHTWSIEDIIGLLEKRQQAAQGVPDFRQAVRNSEDGFQVARLSNEAGATSRGVPHQAPSVKRLDSAHKAATVLENELLWHSGDQSWPRSSRVLKF